MSHREFGKHEPGEAWELSVARSARGLLFKLHPDKFGAPQLVSCRHAFTYCKQAVEALLEREKVKRYDQKKMWELPPDGPLEFIIPDTDGPVTGFGGDLVAKIDAITDEQFATTFRRPLAFARYLGVPVGDVSDNSTYPEGYTRRPP